MILIKNFALCIYPKRLKRLQALEELDVLKLKVSQHMHVCIHLHKAIFPRECHSGGWDYYYIANQYHDGDFVRVNQ